MSKLVASELVSLDGVVGSPDEWQLPYFNDEMGKEIEAAMAKADTMLLGRVTYEERAAFFLSRNSEDLPSANYLNQTLKYVVSTTLEESLEWNNSTLIKGEPRGSDRRAQAAAGKGYGCLWQPHPRPVPAWRGTPRRAQAHGPSSCGGRREAPLRGRGAKKR